MKHISWNRNKCCGLYHRLHWGNCPFAIRRAIELDKYMKKLWEADKLDKLPLWEDTKKAPKAKINSYKEKYGFK